MAGFLNAPWINALGYTAPVGETLQGQFAVGEQQQQKQAQQKAAMGLLQSLPDEYQALKEAGNVSQDPLWALQMLGDPAATVLKEQHLASRAKQLMTQNPAMSREDAMQQAAMDEGDFEFLGKLGAKAGKDKPTLSDKLGYFASRMGPNDLPPDLQRQGERLFANPTELGADDFEKAIQNYDNKKIGRRASPFTYTDPGSGITYGGGMEPEVEMPSETGAPGYGGAPAAAPGPTAPPPIGAPPPAPAPGDLPPDVRAAIPRGVTNVHALKPPLASAAIRTAVAPMGQKGLRVQNDFLALGGGDYATSRDVWDRTEPERLVVGARAGLLGTIPTDNPQLATLYADLDEYTESVGIAGRLASGGRAGYGTRRAETLIKPTSNFDTIMTVLSADAVRFKETLQANGITPGPEFDRIRSLQQLRAMKPAGTAPPTHTDSEGRPMRWGTP